MRGEHRSEGPFLAYVLFKTRTIGPRLHGFCTQARGHRYTRSIHVGETTLGWHAAHIWNSILG